MSLYATAGESDGGPVAHGIVAIGNILAQAS